MGFYERTGKLKAITFSYDDGVTQDIQLVNLLNKYGLKCTFNLNSERMSHRGTLTRENKLISYYKLFPEDVKRYMKGTRLPPIHLITLNCPK